jgi:acyl carrier protein
MGGIMNLKASEQEVRAIVAKIIKMKENEVDINADLFADYGVDSLAGVEIFAALDKKYKINVPESRLKSIKSVKDLTDLVNSFSA